MFCGILPLFFLTALAGLAAGHASIWHPSMWGFNVTQQTFSYDNRPVSPLVAMTFDQWWFHGHLDHPPHPEDVYQLPVGQPATLEIACTKSATSFFASSGGGDIQNGNDPCPGSPPSEFHTTGIDDVKGCSLAIAYKSNVSDVKPEDFTVFSVNHTCVWNRFTDFQVPARMPPCPPGGCTCAFFWIHSPDSGSEQNYMNGFQCDVTGSTSNVALATPQLPRRCGADPTNGKPDASPGNCTYGAKQPFYWFQKEQNNMFEGTYAPPFYTDLYNFQDGAQDDIFQDSYVSMPPPGPNASVPVLNPSPGSGGGSSSVSAAAATTTASQVSSVTTDTGSTSSVATATATVQVTRTVLVPPSASVPASFSTAVSISVSASIPASSLAPASVSTSLITFSALLSATSVSASVSTSAPASPIASPSSIMTIFLDPPSSSAPSFASPSASLPSSIPVLAPPSPPSSSVEHISLSLSSVPASAPTQTQTQTPPPKQLDQSASAPSASPSASNHTKTCKPRSSRSMRKRSYRRDFKHMDKRHLWSPFSLNALGGKDRL